MGRVHLTRRTRGAPLGWLYRRLTAGSRPLPDFLIVGAKRCGTSWSYRTLAEHPRVLRAWRKEIHYFDRDDAFARGPGWYRAHFPRTWPGVLTGEATPEYLYVPAVAPRLAALVPDAKLIALLRDPIDRAHSHYEHNRRVGVERRTFEAALEAQAENVETGDDDDASYLTRGHYAEQLARLFQHFAPERVLVVRSEDFFDRSDAVMGTMLRFLGLPAGHRPFSGGPRHSPYPSMPEATRARLVEYYRSHNERLYGLLGRDMGFSR